ncbi:MAG: aldo/keto reductase [Erysipelotrichaceae bacterium]|jgi:predicted aldo/keto reductase-like oxidoreductase
MKYNVVCNEKLSLLGFGLMRLPLMKNGEIDQKHLEKMVEYALSNGVNYFDTAYPYHGGNSEIAIGKALAKYPRDSFYLASKYPGHQIVSTGYYPAEVFEKQLEKCKVDYFDFYLLHNVNDKSIETYLDERWKIVDYFLQQKELGRIKHLGFSSHASLEKLEEFLDIHGDKMEFCQIQLNYLDWTLQQAKEKYELLTERNIPVWVMEPVRGGKLAVLDETNEKKLLALKPDKSIASWGFEFLKTLDNVKMVLSGMSNIDQMIDNVKTFKDENIISKEEVNLLLEIAEDLKKGVPCTKCEYCLEGCPMGLNIPLLLEIYNDLKFYPSSNTSMRIEFMDEDKKPYNCIGCGACSSSCPQNIDIPNTLSELSKMIEKLPSWAQICKEREEEAKKFQ